MRQGRSRITFNKESRKWDCGKWCRLHVESRLNAAIRILIDAYCEGRRGREGGRMGGGVDGERYKRYITLGRYQTTSSEVDLVSNENDCPRRYVVATPKGLENLLGHSHRSTICRRINDAICVRFVRRYAGLRL